MSLLVFSAVILAALLHALWNALLKAQPDKYAGAFAVSLGGVPLGLACLAYAGLPAVESWPYVVSSAIIHTFYFLCLLNAYRAADFTQVYPIARGAAPVFTALASGALLGEVLSPLQATAVAIIACGVMSLVFAGRGGKSLSASGLCWALATSAIIATYSLNDGAGARLAGNSFAFYGASATLNAILMAIYFALRQPAALRNCFTVGRRSLLIGGPVSFIAYALVTWAFAHAPIAMVSALREVSIVFAVLIGTFVLHEKMDWRRILSSFVTLTGVVLMRVAR
ncbi:EamA family transporter [Aureimonas fodinaquatilis]|uniref:EamA family transporter n=1 Tax=Aureimonas fodinaquatilis TaxID=2565783 RepID=A0A5B0DVZ6_9HYPH|nr:DMT family transporter [Aureimonas fodinaquatilis]KAA0970924.1 EamA family transporter [Aureimonas fodinaquatilis]